MVDRIRTSILILAALLAGMVVAQWNGQQVQAIQDDDNPAVADLRERLNSGLRLRTDAEKTFVEQVVSGVEAGSIPRDLVDSTFLWVRSNKGHSNYPFFYFERVLRLRAKKLDIPIPDFQTPNFSPNR